jgi:hypothetical protein
VFTRIRTPSLEQLKVLAARGDALAAQAQAEGNSANGANLRGVRDQYDTLAWLFAQTSAIVTPLSKAEVLLSQYRRNLRNWRDATDKQYREALRVLGLRLALFADCWQSCLQPPSCGGARYFTTSTKRRRSRFLLLRKIVLWHRALVSVVGYFFRSEIWRPRGDRVQIGNAPAGHDLGLVRLHLMELSGQGR